MKIKMLMKTMLHLKIKMMIGEKIIILQAIAKISNGQAIVNFKDYYNQRSHLDKRPFKWKGRAKM